LGYSGIPEEWTWFLRDDFRENYDVFIDIFIDNNFYETVKLPTKYEIRKNGIT